MKRATLVCVVLSTFLVAGCLPSSGSLWLRAGDIDMKEYTPSRVIVLPVETSPSLSFDEGERVSMQSQVKNNLVKVFNLEKVDSLESAQGSRAFPYRLEELTRIAQLYAAHGVAAVSVFSLTRDDSHKVLSIGVRIVFADANDASKSWTMTRQYRSESGFGAGSRRFDNTIYVDFQSVERQLGKGDGFFGMLGGLSRPASDAPGVTIAVVGNDAKSANNEANLVPAEGDISTTQSEIEFRVQAEDPAGLVSTHVFNKRRSYSHIIPHTLPDALGGEAMPYIVESVLVPLVVGKNVVEFTTSNQTGKETRHEVTVTRVASEPVYALGVGIGNYQAFGDSNVKTQELQAQFKAAQRPVDEVRFLGDANATQRAIQRELYELGTLASRNDQGLGVFYFAGKVYAGKAGIFLLAYDSEPDFAEVTGIDVGVLKKSLPKNGVAILDLCERNPSIQKQLLAELPSAVISFDSCTPGVDTLAGKIDVRLKEGMSLKQAIEVVSKEQRR